jgi:hypothetical protein
LLYFDEIVRDPSTATYLGTNSWVLQALDQKQDQLLEADKFSLDTTLTGPLFEQKESNPKLMGQALIESRSTIVGFASSNNEKTPLIRSIQPIYFSTSSDVC